MKWYMPEEGTRKIVKKFAFWPKQIYHNDKLLKIWLEFYYDYCEFYTQWYRVETKLYKDVRWIKTGNFSTKKDKIKDKIGME
jgi:hypothetical protein